MQSRKTNTKKSPRQQSERSQRAPWQISPGIERMLPLMRAICLAEEAAVVHGPDISTTRDARHQKAWAAFKACLDALDELWEHRKQRASRHGCFTFGDLESFHRELSDWTADLVDVAMHWADWGTYSRSDVRARAFRLAQKAQEFEKRLAAAEARIKSGKKPKRKRSRAKRTQPTAQQSKAYKLHKNGLTFREIGEELHISHTTARNWTKLAEAHWEPELQKARSVRVSQTLPTDKDEQVCLSEDSRKSDGTRRPRVKRKW